MDRRNRGIGAGGMLFAAPSLVSGFLFLCLFAALAWLLFQRSGGEQLSLPAGPSWRPVVADSGERLGDCRWPWQKGDGLVDTQGRYWRVDGNFATAASLGEVSDPVLDRALCPVSVLLPQDGAKGVIALLTPGLDDGHAAVWERVLEQAGYRVTLSDGLEAGSSRSIREASMASPAAIVRIRQSPAGGWRGTEHDRHKAQLVVERGHPRLRSNLGFALRWQKKIQEGDRPPILLTGRRLGQHLSPRAVDVLLPESFVASESIALARGLAAALEPDSLTKESQSVIMDRRITDIRGPRP
ncbi:hypothetical protein HM1_1983 [Heliomicrobium modesticaldum Ice1]|uniref:Uncharacterized protein n=1 Tax=Heliobacterium modesticaldum (strain ATCC 51547 / Ice1) TaxID=498761 RepID=B0TFW1_HELMI|nr:hypothetical protein [Heliomicrobium modesticaldum]ABZ84541.1 hypothetical protein HM1_1983 [Heliomicrobium modesticaldum Ice1]